jgi:hypothetical protein
MKTMLIALALGGAVAASAAPAMAQYSYYGNSYGAIQAREDRLAARITRALSDGDITLSQARSLRYDLRRIVNLDRRYRWDGLTLAERADLVSELNGLESSLRYDIAQNGDTDDADYGYGYYR